MTSLSDTANQSASSASTSSAADLAHELKTPLAAMSALADAITNESDLARSRQLATRLRDEAERACGVIDGLLSLDDPQRAAVDSVPARRLAQRAADRLANSAHLRNVVVSVTGDESLNVTGDPVELESAAYHLLENAIQHSPAGGRVEVVISGNDVGRVEISVIDAGAGIPNEHLEHIFERFYSSDGADNKSGGVRGKGLGLAIVKRAVEQNNGEVFVSSNEMAGTRFVLRLTRGGNR